MRTGPSRLAPYILSLLVTVVYIPTFMNGFVWDDKICVIGNDVYKHFDLFKILFSSAQHAHYQPLSDLSFAADYLIWGENPVGFHLTNLLLAVAVSLAIYKFVFDFCDCLSIPSEQRAWFASVVAGLCLLHPVHAQTVDFIICRNALLASLFFFISLIFFLHSCTAEDKRTQARNLVASLFAFCAALLSKPTAIALPLVLTVLALYLPNRKRALKSSLPFFGPAVVFYLLFREVAVENNVARFDLPEFGIFSATVKASRALQVPFFYLRKIFVPSGFSPEYDASFAVSLSDPLVLAAAGGIALLLLLAWRLRASNRSASFGILFFLATLPPVLHLFPTYPTVADRYIFLPFFGIALAAASFLLRLAANGKGFRPLCCLLLAALAFLTVRQHRTWFDEESLWKTAVAVSPNNARAQANLGAFYFSKGWLPEAMACFSKAVEIDPTKPNLEFSQGIVAGRKKDYAAALSFFKKALERDENFLPAMLNAGITALKLNDPKSASGFLQAMDDSSEPDIYHLRQRRDLLVSQLVWPSVSGEVERLKTLLARTPENLNGQVCLMTILFSCGRYAEVLQHYQAVSWHGEPPAEAMRLAGLSRKHMGDATGACDLLAKSLTGRDPAKESALPLARMYEEKHDFAQAVALLTQAAKGGDPRAAAELATLYFRLGSKEDSARWIERAEEMAPQALNLDGYEKQLRRM